MARHLHGHVQLIARPAHIGHAGRSYPSVAEIDLAGVREFQGAGRQIIRRHPSKQLARVRPHHAEHAPQRRHIGQHRVFVGVDMPADPVGIAHRLGRARDQQEALARGILGQAHDGQVALEATADVEQAGVDHAAHRHVHVVGAQALQHRQRVAPLQQQLAKGGLVVDGHGLARGTLLFDHPVQPARATQRVSRAWHSGRAEVVGALPAILAAEIGVARAVRAGARGSRQQVVQRAGAQRARGLQLLARPAHGVVQAQRLARALSQALAIGVVRAEAADVHVPQVAGGLAIGDPLRDQLARTAGVGDAGRIETGADEVIAQLRCLAQDEIAIGREALRAVEQHLDLGRLQAGCAVDGVGHQDLELVPVLVQQLELEAAGDRVHRPGFGLGFEAAHEQAAHLLLVVDEAVGVAHHRQHGVHAFDLVGDDVEVLSRVQRHRHPRQRAELPRPLAGTVHQRLAVHIALRGAHAHGARPARALGGEDPRDLHALHHAHPAVARALGQ